MRGLFKCLPFLTAVRPSFARDAGSDSFGTDAHVYSHPVQKMVAVEGGFSGEQRANLRIHGEKRESLECARFSPHPLSQPAARFKGKHGRGDAADVC